MIRTPDADTRGRTDRMAAAIRIVALVAVWAWCVNAALSLAAGNYRLAALSAGLGLVFVVIRGRYGRPAGGDRRA